MSNAFKNRFAPAANKEPDASKALQGGITLPEELAQFSKNLHPAATTITTTTTDSVKSKPSHYTDNLRFVIDWSPHPLLCKRMNIPLPETALPEQQRIKSEREAQRNGVELPPKPIDTYEDSLLHKAGVSAGGFGTSGTTSISKPSTEGEVNNEESIIAQISENLIPNRPPMDLFKSIFDDDSSSSSDDDDDDDDGIDESGNRNGTDKLPNTSASRIHTEPQPQSQPTANSSNQVIDNNLDVQTKDNFLPTKITFSRFSSSNIKIKNNIK